MLFEALFIEFTFAFMPMCEITIAFLTMSVDVLIPNNLLLHVYLQRSRLTLCFGTVSQQIHVQTTPQTSVRVLAAPGPV